MKGTYWEICTAPPPEDIDWSSFFQPDEGRILRRVMIELTNFALMFAYSVPVGSFSPTHARINARQHIYSCTFRHTRIQVLM